MELYIDNHQQKIDATKLESLVHEALVVAHELTGITNETEISVVLVDDQEIRELNKEYRGIDQATDVLSFALEEGLDFVQPLGEPIVLGDIVISLERAEAQRMEYGHSLEREVGYLAVHGFLHLIGYDHLNETDKKSMRLKEEEIMSKLSLTRD